MWGVQGWDAYSGTGPWVQARGSPVCRAAPLENPLLGNSAEAEKAHLVPRPSYRLQGVVEWSGERRQAWMQRWAILELGAWESVSVSSDGHMSFTC